mmetsp:Transcript_3196/g.7568  ORF Transcript_3196/g.7568 Transcript_3196/m.7568 type:complete len:207 (+) Transcript_3196:327-947(+)
MYFALRWEYILQQLRNGTSILMTDVDNIFNRYIDPISHPDLSGFDVIHAYSGSNYPRNVYEKIGFVVCGGLTLLKANPRAIAYIEKILERCGIMCDDQIVINEMIANEFGISWDNNATRKARTGRSNVTGHTLKVLDHEWAYRDGGPGDALCPKRDDNWIAMPHADRKVLKIQYNRRNAPLFKIAMFDHFDKTCGLEFGLNKTKKA